MNATQAHVYALQAIRHERERQVEQWGDQHDDKHGAHEWALLLMKHVGRLAGDLLEDGEADEHYDRLDVYNRTVVIGALTLAFAEWQNRRRGKPEPESTTCGDEDCGDPDHYVVSARDAVELA